VKKKITEGRIEVQREKSGGGLGERKEKWR
jgi:hypothetical protein